MKISKKTIKQAKPFFEELKNEREKQGLSLEYMAGILRMNKEHLFSIESGHFSALPFAPIYKKNLIGNYAEALGLSKILFMKRFELESHETKILKTQNQTKISPIVFSKFQFRGILIASFSLCIAMYLGMQIKEIVSPPELLLFSPINGIIVKSEETLVKGKTEKEVKIKINGKEIKHDDQGIFNEEVPLSTGVNTLVISATTKHGKTTTFTRYVTRSEASEISLLQNNSNQN